MAVKLDDLVRTIAPLEVRGDQGLEITAVTADSRRAGSGTIFVAVKGVRADGHRFLAAALEAGSPALVIMADMQTRLDPRLLERAPALVVVDDSRPVPALLARALAHEPDRTLFTAGVTGTNGKTTVAFLLRSVLERLRGPCGLLGTIRYQAVDTVEPAPLTTPAGPDLYRWLETMVAEGCRSVALELSSHALDQRRAAGLELDVAVMTNLGRDHLDYHPDLDAYLAAKARILGMLRAERGQAVINADDPGLAPLAHEHPDAVLFSVSGRPVVARRCDLSVTSSRLQLTGTSLDLDWRGHPLHVESPLVGLYNVENLTAALAAVLAAGFPCDEAVTALDSLQQVPGRLERFVLPVGGLAVVDYAHTPDALAAVLSACRGLTDRRVLVVFGCGGDRDRGKRPLMGKVAAELADEVWITADNPRSENPAAINEEIMKGVKAVAAPRAGTVHLEPDRRAAVAEALSAAGERDVVVIAGKGHEDYQLVGDEVLPLDDRNLVREWIAAAGGHHG